MHVSLRLLLSAMLEPPALSLWLTLLGIVLLRRWPWRGRALIGLGLGSLFLLSEGLCAGWLARGLEPPAIPQAELAQRLQGWQAIVVLGAGRDYGAPEFSDQDIPSYWGAARVRYAALLYRASGLPILVSGGHYPEEKESEAAIMARSLVRDHVVPVHWQEGNSLTTWENAEFSARILQAQGIRRVVLVTSAVHMRRSVGIFQHFGFTVLPAATDYADYSREPLALQLVPKAKALQYSEQAFHEYVGLLVYQVREWVG